MHRFATLPLLLLGATPQAASEKLLIRAGYAHLDPDQGLANPSLLCEGGKVTEVASRPDPSGKAPFEGRAEKVLDFPTAIVTAGFIDPHCTLGDRSQLSEPVESLTPELRAAQAFDPYDKSWKTLYRKGVTSVVFSPDDRNLAGGFAAFAKPGSGSARGDNYLKLSLTRAMLNRERRPTSLMGGVEYLRNRLDALKDVTAEQGGPALRALRSVVGGGRQVGISCRGAGEIGAVLDLVEAYGFSAFLIHADEADKVLPRLKEVGVSVVLDALDYSTSPRRLELPGILARHEIPFAFSGESKQKTRSPVLRRSLAIAVRQGLPPKTALAAVTTVPAGLAGAGDRVGSLFKGRDADLLVWSGQPWDLRARLLLVVRDGRILFQPKVEPEKSENEAAAEPATERKE
ncbi:MAG: amidohydrolase family protein [Planctomycetota bacterium]